MTKEEIYETASKTHNLHSVTYKEVAILCMQEYANQQNKELQLKFDELKKENKTLQDIIIRKKL